VRQYIDPAATIGFAVAAVPDPVFNACRRAHLEAYRGHPDATDSFLVTYGGAPAGFAFVTRLDGPYRSIGDFFVVRAARRRVVGRRSLTVGGGAALPP